LVGGVMDVPESCALEALKAAMPFREAEQLAVHFATQAVQLLDSYNQKYMADHAWFEEGRFLPFVPMDNNDIERAVAVLSRYYLLLWHRRGLVGS
jgi:hypothetical protein